eukprot:CAMPEP_0204210928 /NCGR_PEP_ID=MMETSP0361-20130328/74274_1 /ASSEMBLY_ACC=CAM_ASM_000343 /TAXON_ID=268821 /ORGANISM="Scrippsiella Hangoei, Strain SHTV-5" /LENGTH=568 /DNA_ID=CAMNT_0051175129 /DNA_START=59 /DNA_END=1762 /DNA_ORIENTATION=-
MALGLFALLNGLLSARVPPLLGSDRPVQILSVGRTASWEGEADLPIDELLPSLAPVHLDVLVANACSVGGGGCSFEPWPRSARLVLQDGFFAVVDAMKIRLDESYDAVVANYCESNLADFSRAVHGMLRSNGTLVFKCDEGDPAASREWLLPWFSGFQEHGEGVWTAQRREPEPARLRIRRQSGGDSGAPPGSLNCSSICFGGLARRARSDVLSYTRTLELLRMLSDRRPIDARNAQLRLSQAVGATMRGLEGDIIAALSQCGIPLPAGLEAALASTFQALSRFLGRLSKVNFHLFTGQDTRMHLPAALRGPAMSSNRAKNVLFDTRRLMDFARRPVELLQGVALAAAAAPWRTGTVRSEAAAAAASPPRQQRERELVGDPGDMWTAVSSAGEMPSTDLTYRAIFDSQLVDEGLLPALASTVFSVGDAIGDFGASLGGYSKFFNLTGLLQAFAFDGAEGVVAASGGAVQRLALDKPFSLWRTFDWVLCLEVLEHIPAKFERAALENLRRHAAKGAVISWAPLYTTYLDPLHVNGKDDAEAREALRAVGFERDEAATALLRGASKQWWL